MSRPIRARSDSVSSPSPPADGDAAPLVPGGGESAAPADAPLRFYEGATISREESVGWLMKQAVAALGKGLHDRMTTIGVTSAQWPLLLVIAHGSHQTAADLARTLSMNAGAMTRMLDRLAEKGLIERNRCPDDRRATRIALTPSGKLAVSPINDVLADTLNDALRGFDRDEYTTLIGLLKRLLANTRTMPAYRAPAAHKTRRAAAPTRSVARR